MVNKRKKPVYTHFDDLEKGYFRCKVQVEEGEASSSSVSVAAKRRRESCEEEQEKLRAETGASKIPFREGTCGFIINGANARASGHGLGDRLEKHLTNWHPNVLLEQTPKTTSSTSQSSAPENSQRNSTLHHHFKMFVETTPAEVQKHILRMVCEEGENLFLHVISCTIIIFN